MPNNKIYPLISPFLRLLHSSPCSALPLLAPPRSVDKSRGVIADNAAIYNDFGSKLVASVVKGVDAFLVTYGSTGSGKSHTLFGSRSAPGVLRLALQGLFQQLPASPAPVVALSLFSIYDEKVTDMLSTRPSSTAALKIVEHPAAGVFVPNLTAAVAATADEACDVVESALLSRALAATRLNSPSSHCHVVVQATVLSGSGAAPAPTMTFIDMAGNEPLIKLAASSSSAASAAAGGSSGAAAAGPAPVAAVSSLTAASINRSVATFTEIVDTLAKNGSATSAIPYPRSALTWLLKRALGGAARTLLLATVSPTADAYQVTLATLRLADRARRVRCRPQPGSAAARAAAAAEVKAEVDRLESVRAARGLAPGAVSFSSLSGKRKDEYTAFQADIELWSAVYAAASATAESVAAAWPPIAEQRRRAITALGLIPPAEGKTDDAAHLVVLNDDPLLSRRLRYAVNKPVLRVCTPAALPPPTSSDIVVTGLQLLTEHAQVTLRDGAASLVPAPNARVFLNGTALSSPGALEHGARIVMGSNLALAFEAAGHALEDSHPTLSYQSVQQELSKTAVDSMIGLDEVVLRETAQKDSAVRAEQKAAMAAEIAECLRGFQLAQEQWTAKMSSVAERIAAAHADGEQRLARATETTLPTVRHQVGESTRVVTEERAQLIADWDKTKSDYEAREAKLKKKLAKLESMGDALSDAKKAEAEQKRKLKEQSLMRVLPMINEANALCVELGQLQVRSAVKLGQTEAEAEAAALAEQALANGSDTAATAAASASAAGIASGNDTGVAVKVTNSDMDVEVVYSEDAFADLLFRWREVYNAYLEEGTVSIPAREDENPFYITPQGPQLIGSCRVYLQGLFYLLPITEKTPVIDYKGDAQGKLEIQVLPLPRSFGKDNEEIYFPEEDITELENESLTFLIRIRRASGIPKRLCKNVFVRYRCFFDGSVQESEPALLSSVNPKLDYRRTVRMEVLSKDWIKTLHDAMVEIQVFGEFPNNADLVRSDPLWQRLVTVLGDAETKTKKTVARLQKELTAADKELRGVGKSSKSGTNANADGTAPEGGDEGKDDETAGAAADGDDDDAAAGASARFKPSMDPETILNKVQDAYERQCVLESEKAQLERRIMIATKEAQDAMAAAAEAKQRYRRGGSSSSSSKSERKDKKDKREKSSLSTLSEDAEDSVVRANSGGMSDDIKAMLADTHSNAEVARALAQVAAANAERETLRARLTENAQRQEDEQSELAQLRAELAAQRAQLEEVEAQRKADRQAMVTAAFNGEDGDKTLAMELRKQEAEASEVRRKLADAEAELAKSKAVFEVLRKSKEDALAEEREEREQKEREHEDEVRRLREMLKKERELRVAAAASASAGASGAAPAQGAASPAQSQAGGRPQQQQQQQPPQQQPPPQRANSAAAPAPAGSSNSVEEEGNPKSTGCVVM
mgnify:CR=1 FL=1